MNNRRKVEIILEKLSAISEKSFPHQAPIEPLKKPSSSNDEMLRLCKLHHVNSKSGIDLLDEIEHKYSVALTNQQVFALFQHALTSGYFRARSIAPNSWRRESSSVRCEGSPFNKGIED